MASPATHQRFREQVHEGSPEQQWKALREFIHSVIVERAGAGLARAIDADGIADRVTAAACAHCVELTRQGETPPKIGEALIVFIEQRFVLEMPLPRPLKAH